MISHRKRSISILICAVMCLTLLPAQRVFGEESDIQQENTIQQESGTQQAVAVSASAADALYASVKEEYQAVRYEDLFSMLNPNVGYYEKFNIETALTKELGRPPTNAEINDRLAQIYLDRLDMRDSFEKVMSELDSIMPKVLENSRSTDAVYIIKMKQQVLFALTYLNRYYSFEAGGIKAKDIILYSPEIVGAQPSPDALTTLTGLGGMSYNEAKGNATAKTYTNKLSWVTGIDDITGFLQKMLEGTKAGISADEYLRQSNAVIEERGQESFFAKMQSDNRLKSYLLPLLSLSTKSIYIVSADYTTTVGLTSTYGGAQDEEFKTRIIKAADGQQSFMDFWKRTSKTAGALDLGGDIVVVDTMAVKGENGESTSQLWSAECGDAADIGVREFMTPMGLYRTYMSASAEADINSSTVQFFMCKGLMDSGINAYTHELTHIYDDKVWFNGYGLREGVSGEAYATGFFESENNTQKRDGGASSYDPIFNLNTAYTLGDNRIQNRSPERFAEVEDLGEYMQGLMDVVYTLDIIEAEEILKLSNADKAILFNKVSLVDDASQAGRKLDKFENITEEEAAKLNTVDDLVDNNIVSGRLVPKGSETTQTISYNDYVVIPMFEGVFAGLQNDEGNTGEFLFRRYAHELLGEYGWEKGMVAYASNQYANDGEALNAILDEKYGGSLAAFKKDMFQRRADKLDKLKPTATYEDVAAMRQAIGEALQADLADMKEGMKNASGSDPYSSAYMLYVKEVQDVKADIFKEYLLMTEDFTKSIYESDESDPTPTPEPDPTPTPTPEPEEPETCSPSDHQYSAYVTTVKAGFGKAGIQTATCIQCKETTNRTIAAASSPILSATKYTYDGKVKKPTVIVAGLKENTDFTVAYKNNVYPGTATVTVSGKGNYSGSLSKTFTITKANQTIAGAAAFNKAYGNKAFSLGASAAGKVTYKSSNAKIAKVSGAGKITIKNTGRATITISAAATGTHNATVKKVTINVSPKKVASLKAKSTKKKKATISWKRDKKATGYQIVYSTDKKFKKSVKKANISKNKTVKKTLSKLKRKKTYYVKVRAYKKVGNTKIYGPYSAVKKVKVK